MIRTVNVLLEMTWCEFTNLLTYRLLFDTHDRHETGFLCAAVVVVVRLFGQMLYI